MSTDPNHITQRRRWEQLPSAVLQALIEEAERVWNGEGDELRFWRNDRKARIRRVTSGENRSVAT